MMLKLPEVAEKINADMYPFNRDKDYEKWVDSRYDYVGSSTIAAILGLNAYETPLSTWKKYTDRKSSYVDNDHTIAGNFDEPLIQQLTERQHPQYEILPYNVSHISKEFPFATATPDGIIDSPGRAWGVNEVKRTNAKKDLDTWLSGNVPLWVYAQIQWQMGVCDLKWGVISAMVLGNVKIKVKEVEFQPDLFAGMIAKAQQFLTNVEQGTPPKPGGSAEDTRIVNGLTTVETGETMALEGDDGKVLERLYDLKAKSKELSTMTRALDKERKEIENELKTLGDGAQIITNGSYQVKLNKINMPEQVRKAYSYITVTSKKVVSK